MNTLMFGVQKRAESLVLSFINGSHKKVVAFVTLASMVAVMIPPSVALAAGIVGAVTFNGTATASVVSGSSVSVVIPVSLSGGDDWESTSYKIGSGSAVCVNTTDKTSSGSNTITITAPATVGSHNVEIKVFGYNSNGFENNSCSSSMGGLLDTEIITGALTVTPDTTPPPAPSITVGPVEGSTVASSTTSFSFTSEAGATFECQIDAGAFSVCSSPKVLTGLIEGAHTFTVKAKDGAGNYSTETVRNFIVDIDTDAPVISAVTVSPFTTNDTTPSFTLTSNEAGTVVVGGASCSIPSTNAVAGNTTITFNTLSNGNTYNCTVRVKDSSNNLSNVLSVPITVNTSAFDNAMVSLSFDDGWQSVYDNALPLLDAKGYKSTQYIYSDAMNGVHGTIYMNAGEVAALRVAGHDIGAHSRTHSVSLAGTLSTSTRESEISGSRLDLLSLGSMAPVNNFAYPFGDGFDDAVITGHLKSAGYAGARTTQDGYNDKSTDRYALKIFEVTRDTTLAQITEAVDVAIATKTWVIFMFHQIEGTCPADTEFDYCLPTATLSGLLDYVQTSGVAVKTVSEGLALMPAHASSGASAPVITQADLVVPATSPAGAVVTYSPSVTDSDAVNSPAPLKAYCTTPGGLVSGSTFPVGVTTVTCSAADAGGNLATTDTSFTVTVNADLVAPSVVLSSAVVSPTKNSPVAVTATFSEPVLNFVASDVVVTNAGTPVSNFAGSGTTYTFNVAPTIDGVVTVTVPATAAQDVFGNGNTVSNTITFTYDHTAPVVTLNGDAVSSINTGSTYTELGATAVDAIDASVTVVTTGSVNTALPGTYVLTYSSTDDAGNIGTATRTVNVSDATAPVISGVPANMTLEATSPAGAIGTYTLPTANDDVDGVVVVVCTPVSGSTFPLGLSTVTCSATDAALNVQSTSFTVTVLDTTAPVLTAPANQTFEATGVMTTPTLVLASVTDIADVAPVVTYDIHNFGIGTETVVWSATDSSGNIASTTTSLVTIVDTTAPVVTISAVPTPTNTVPAVGFTATDLVTASGSLIVECSLDGGAFEACTSPFAPVIVADGTHTVVVRATDAAGMVGTDDVSFVIDTVDPTAQVSYDIETLTNTDVVATLGSESETITVTSIGGSTHTFTTNGIFTFEFTDAAGNNGSTVATVNWIDKSAPTIIIDTFPLVNIANQSAITVSGACSENDTLVTLTLGSLNATPNCDGGAWTSTFDLSAELDGVLTLSASQTDAAGNTTTVTSNSSKDTVTPIGVISYNISSPTNTDVVAVITGSETITVTNNGGLLSHTFTENGSFTFEFVDTAGNPGSSVASVSNIDKTLPTIEITAEPAASINVNTATVNYVAADLVAAPSTGVVTVTCLVTGGGTINSCSATSSALSALPDGSHTFTVTATDSVGNIATDSTTFVVDFTNPVVTIGAIAGLPTTPSIPFTVVDDSVVTTECKVNDGAFVACTSPFAPALVDGTYTVTVRATDAVGNVSADALTASFVVDLPATIALNGANPFHVALETVFTDPGATAGDTTDGDLTSAIVISGLVSTSTNGTYTVTYTVLDSANNISSTTRTVIVSDLTLSDEEEVAPTTNSIQINWTTSHPATSRVIWDTVSHTDASTTEAIAPNYGYANSTTEDAALVTNHSVTVTGLSEGTTYYFRPVSHGSPETFGAEVSGTTGVTPPAPQRSSGGGGGSFIATNYGVKINNGAATTNSANVTLTITKPLNATQIWLSNSNLFTEGTWVPFAETTSWTLASGSGVKNVFIRFGFSSTTVATAQASIRLTDGSTPSTGGQVLGASTGVSCYVFTQTLGVGSSGADVTALQNRLIAEGVYSGPVTGYFGQMTKTAVIAYQAKKGIAQVGLVGPQTRASLNVCEGSVLGASTTVPSGLSDAAKATMMKQLADLLALVAKLQAELKAMKAQ